MLESGLGHHGGSVDHWVGSFGTCRGKWVCLEMRCLCSWWLVIIFPRKRPIKLGYPPFPGTPKSWFFSRKFGFVTQSPEDSSLQTPSPGECTMGAIRGACRPLRRPHRRHLRLDRCILGLLRGKKIGKVCRGIVCSIVFLAILLYLSLKWLSQQWT